MSNKLSTNFNKNITLDCATLNKKYVIAKCSLPEDLKMRFAELGLTEGTKITVIKKAPLSDPLEIRARGYSLCIRRKEASFFEIREAVYE